MANYKVKFLPDNKIVDAATGEDLLSAAKRAGIDIQSPCGGFGTCGKCAVKVLSGHVETEGDGHMTEDQKKMGYIAACRARVVEDLTIEIPEVSRLTKHKIVLSSKDADDVNKYKYFQQTEMKPLGRKLTLELSKPDFEDSTNDMDRLLIGLTRAYGIKKPYVSIEVMRKLPLALREGDWTVTATLVEIGDMAEIVSIEAGKAEKPAYGFAVDIGTTTVAAALVDLKEGKVVDKAGTYNRQATYGSDVISRIVFEDEDPEGLELLHKAVVDTINSLIEEILIRQGLQKKDITVMVCAGNTVMSHFFMKLTAKYLRLEPYIPTAVSFPPVKAGAMGIGINPEGIITIAPSVASYVGGDITAGVLATMLARDEKLTLFIDVGTNGEIAIGNNEWIVTCACSAGPAFEGSGISCGMRAMDGAVDRIEINKEDNGVSYTVIGDKKPLGICGSGLIYSLSEMMEAGIIDRAGKILENQHNKRIRRDAEGMEFVVAYGNDSNSGQDIVITEGDVKNLLRAKGAIFAGIRTMLEQLQMDITLIDRVYIAGGFGKYINVTDAINIGLLPDIPIDKYEFIGNSSVQGAITMLLSNEAVAEAADIAGKMTYIELSVGNTFMDEFISALFIPHTDLGLFPSTMK
jgi:uncharacterized 2Fe-2S/4Fe-4S cluster protein (DUF4445 family)